MGQLSHGATLFYAGNSSSVKISSDMCSRFRPVFFCRNCSDSSSVQDQLRNVQNSSREKTRFCGTSSVHMAPVSRSCKTYPVTQTNQTIGRGKQACVRGSTEAGVHKMRQAEICGDSVALRPGVATVYIPSPEILENSKAELKNLERYRWKSVP